MSADNEIRVKKDADGKYAVWHDFASNDRMTPPDDADRYDTQAEAIMAAHKMEQDIGYVEYGVQICDVLEEVK